MVSLTLPARPVRRLRLPRPGVYDLQLLPRTGAANLLRYLLDRINESTYNCLIRDIDSIRKGEVDIKNGASRFAGRLEAVMPYREYPRAGTTRFDGVCVVEDVTNSPELTDQVKGLQLVSGS